MRSVLVFFAATLVSGSAFAEVSAQEIVRHPQTGHCLGFNNRGEEFVGYLDDSICARREAALAVYQAAEAAAMHRVSGLFKVVKGDPVRFPELVTTVPQVSASLDFTAGCYRYALEEMSNLSRDTEIADLVERGKITDLRFVVTSESLGGHANIWVESAELVVKSGSSVRRRAIAERMDSMQFESNSDRLCQGFKASLVDLMRSSK